MKSQHVESAGHFSQHPPSRPDIGRAHLFHSLGHRPFDRPGRGPCKRAGARVQPQPRPPAVAGIARPIEQSLRDQSLQDPGNRARVQPDDVCELSRRQAGKTAHDTQDKPLGSSDTELGFHVLGHPLEAVLNGPEEPQEVQDWLERVLTV